MNPLDPSSIVLQTFLQVYQTRLNPILQILKIIQCMNHIHHVLYKNYLNLISREKIFIHFCSLSSVATCLEAIMF